MWQKSDVQRGNSNDDDLEPKAKKPRMTLLLTDSESDNIVMTRQMYHLARYKDENPIAETENPPTWWRLNRNRFPVLANFVKTVSCVSATSMQCERLFSSFRYIVSKTRATVLPENVTTLVCVRDWLKALHLDNSFVCRHMILNFYI